MANAEDRIIDEVIRMLSQFWPLILLAFAAALLKTWFSKSKKKSKTKSPRYISREYLLTEAEAHFHVSLQAALGHLYWVCPKVRLSDIVDPESDLDRSTNQTAWNQISQKHVDFVLCQPGEFRIIAVVELDDSSHHRKHRQDRDAFVDDTLNQVGIPILHVRWAKSYSPEDLAIQISQLITI